MPSSDTPIVVMEPTEYGDCVDATVDTSFFPSSGAVNPALTIMANALRVGDHLRERLG